jgi:hypothetical protein
MKQGTEVPFITLRCAGSFDDKQMTVREDVIIPRTPLYENQVGRIQAHCPTWHPVLGLTLPSLSVLPFGLTTTMADFPVI